MRRADGPGAVHLARPRLVDAVDVALAAEYGTDAVLTRDLRGFRAVRPVGGRHPCFRVLPDDL
ncbi:hypothetical protein [Streptomyces naganishii]|uniref:PIN domain-containing protein n=1 Tax=Streptomyces naganishii JCM 4654 TaxID=1306179 RepID=A0A918XYN9_9ACTN|nr:hypothetical protein GCM10010508_01080 [Streptomyces naganishii JCM 4654]